MWFVLISHCAIISVIASAANVNVPSSQATRVQRVKTVQYVVRFLFSVGNFVKLVAVHV